MKKRPLLLLASAAIILTFILGCGSEPGPEEKARAIYNEALELEKQGRRLEAMYKYDLLVDYKETETYVEAKEALFEKGLSIGGAVQAYTIQLLFNIKNEYVSQGILSHPEGNAKIKLDREDSWGTPIWIEFAKGKRYDFALLSAGPDKAFKTEDDLVLFNHAEIGDRKVIPKLPEETQEKTKEDEKKAETKPKSITESSPILYTDKPIPQPAPDTPEPRRPAKKETATKELTQRDQPEKKPSKEMRRGDELVDLEDLLKQ